MNTAEAGLLTTDRAQSTKYWHVAGWVGHIPEAGDYLTVDLADEPVVVIRNAEGELRALSRVCRHRGFDMLEGTGREGSNLDGPCGRVKRITCPYHAWTYDLDGQLAAAPVSDKMCDFDKTTVALPRFAVEVFEELVFVHLGDKPNDLHEQLAQEGSDLPQLVQHFQQTA